MTKKKKKKYTMFEYKEARFNPLGIKWTAMTPQQKKEFANKMSGDYY